MGSGKILGGLAFLILGIVILVIGIVPIPGLEVLSLYYWIEQEYLGIMALIATFDLPTFLNSSGYLSICTIITLVGYNYVKAGIKSMRYDKPKKQYYYTETKIGMMIAGFITVCVALVLIFMIFIGVLSPAFDFLTPLIALIPFDLSSIAAYLPTILIPVLLTILIIFFVYWIGSKIMKSSVKKESLIT